MYISNVHNFHLNVFYCYDTEEELGLDSTLVSPVKMQVEVLELDLTCKEREEGAAFVGNLLLQ